MAASTELSALATAGGQAAAGPDGKPGPFEATFVLREDT
jgi:hypothetical protein